jgi:hypothetical protein
MGRFQFLVHGYEDDPAELYGIPDVRKFYQHFQLPFDAEPPEE